MYGRTTSSSHHIIPNLNKKAKKQFLLIFSQYIFKHFNVRSTNFIIYSGHVKMRLSIRPQPKSTITKYIKKIDDLIENLKFLQIHKIISIKNKL